MTLLDNTEMDDGSSALLLKETIYGLSLKEKRDIFVSILDPKTHQILVKMKNPRVPI